MAARTCVGLSTAQATIYGTTSRPNLRVSDNDVRLRSMVPREILCKRSKCIRKQRLQYSRAYSADSTRSLMDSMRHIIVKTIANEQE